MTEENHPEEAHRARHVYLHRALDELLADFLKATGNLPSQTSIMELMQWSQRQAVTPDHPSTKG